MVKEESLLCGSTLKKKIRLGYTIIIIYKRDAWWSGSSIIAPTSHAQSRSSNSILPKETKYEAFRKSTVIKSIENRTKSYEGKKSR
jgi:hypothetical protein